MIMKPFEKREHDISSLERLARRTDMSAAVRANIEREMRLIRSGDAAEAETAYQVDFHYGNRQRDNFVVLHNLRLEVAGRVAQIDHLIIDRLMTLYVLESKSFAGGIAINEHGEFTTFFNGKPAAVASPIQQNERHLKVIRQAYDEGMLASPKRLGVTIPISLVSIICVSKGSRITRPKGKVPGLDMLVKSDQLAELRDKIMDRKFNILSMTKIVSRETIEDLGQSLLQLHSPISINWEAKFGIDPQETSAPTASMPETGTHRCCDVCGSQLEKKVVTYCRLNGKKMGGRYLCRNHQP